MSFTVKIKSKGQDGLKEIEKVRKLISGNIKIVAGLPTSAPAYPDSGESVVDVGLQNEFGVQSKRIPERSFLRSTLQENKKKYSQQAFKVIKASIKQKKPIDKTLGLVGQVMEDDIKKKIVDLKTPPNAKFTIDKKGSSNPLVDSGHMGQSIRHEVRTGTGNA